MLNKVIEELQVGDTLTNNADNCRYTITNIIRGDEEGDNYCFFGFCVRRKLLKRFFKLDNVGKFMVHDETKSIIR
jgi:hypothetical protein